MRYLSIVFMFCIVACSTRTTNPQDNTNFLDQYSERIENIISSEQLSKLPLIKDSSFVINPESIKYQTKDLVELNDLQLNYFFSTDKLIELRNYLSPGWFFYGCKLPWKGFLPILILNRGSSGIYLICFLINKEGKSIGSFIPGYYEGQPNYLLKRYGKFLKDSTYVFTEIIYNEIEGAIEIQDSMHLKSFTKDSSITKIFFDYVKGLSEVRKNFPTDTIN